MIKKIGFFVENITIFGGAERATLNLAHVLKNLGYNIVILSFSKTNNKSKFNLDSFEIAYFNEDVKNTIMWPNIYSKYPIYLRAFYKFSKTRKYIKDTFNLSFSACVLSIFLEKKVDLVIDSSNFFNHRLLAKNIPTIRIFHGNFKSITHLLYDLDYYQCLVLLTKTELQKYIPYCKNIKIISNNVSLQTKVSDLKNKQILYLGRLADDKRSELMIIIFSKLDSRFDEFKLKIVGDGQYLEDLKKLTKKLNLSHRVNFVGFKENVSHYYINSCVFCLTSKTECMPMVLLEAASFGLPLLSFDILSGPSDLIKNGKNGFLIKDGDINSYVNALSEILGSYEKMVAFGNFSLEIVKKFSNENISKKWQNLISSIKTLHTLH